MAFTRSSVKAKDVMVDDWFYICGKMNRVTSVTDADDKVRIAYVPESDLSSKEHRVTFVSKNTAMFIYNQSN